MRDINEDLFTWEIGTYDLGKHWPEAGDYQAWAAEKLAAFNKTHHVIAINPCSTNTGGTLLLVKAVAHELFAEWASGLRCPRCKNVFAHADSTAIHLLDDHAWDFEHVRLWLRDRVEEAAFDAQA